jgi:hypothetical protein
MRELRIILLLATSLPASCESCPWLNAATAAGVLGGPVNATVSRTNKNTDDANCDFIRQEGPLEYGLRIEVGTAVQCRDNATPLRAIGNEAMACSYDGKKGQLAEQVVGHVRDRAFLIRTSTNDRSVRSSVLREKARKVAEQVAGTLF